MTARSSANESGATAASRPIRWSHTGARRVVRIPATIPALFDFLQQARERNICLIRGAPANLAREKTRRQKAGGDRGDHGFTDEPTKLLFFDIDGATGNWRDDPEAAVKRIVAQLGEPWASASYVWFFSAGHGLEMETVTVGDKKHKRWTGGISDDKIRVRLAFITDRRAVLARGGGADWYCEGGIRAATRRGDRPDSAA